MYFLDLTILARQLLPPSWRNIKTTIGTITTEKDSGQMNYLKTLLLPFKILLNDFHAFRKQVVKNINLTAQTLVIENHIKEITGISYGIFIQDGNQVNHFTVNVPLSVQAKEKDILQFLRNIVPAGRNYELLFY